MGFEVSYGDIGILFFLTLGPLKAILPFARVTRGTEPAFQRTVAWQATAICYSDRCRRGLVWAVCSDELACLATGHHNHWRHHSVLSGVPHYHADANGCVGASRPGDQSVAALSIAIVAIAAIPGAVTSAGMAIGKTAIAVA
jgi:hypothetical protein